MKDSLKQLQKVGGVLRNNVVLICIVIFGAMYGYLIFTSGQQVSQEPSESQIAQKLTNIKRPQVDDSAAKALRQLSDQNIEVQALFDEARQNPFSE